MFTQSGHARRPAMTFDVEPHAALNTLQRFADVEDFAVVGDFQIGRCLKVLLGQFWATGASIHQAAIIKDARIARALIHRFR